MLYWSIMRKSINVGSIVEHNELRSNHFALQLSYNHPQSSTTNYFPNKRWLLACQSMKIDNQLFVCYL